MTDFILRVIIAGGYWGFAFLMALENVFPPIPSEVIMGFGGLAVARGQFDFTTLVLVATLGATAGNLAWYLVGYHVGIARLRPFIDRHGRWLTVEWADIETLQRRFRTQGGRIVFGFRFLPTFRTIVSLPAGMARMPIARFALFTFAGTGLWNTLLAAAGYWLGAQFGRFDHYLGLFGAAVAAVLVALYLYRVLTWRPRPSA